MWWKDGVIYQIYPRSFKDANGDGTGDLKGITAMLDYLNDGTERSLGVDGIWISPFFRSPMKDFGYDISDYRDVDPIFGTLEDFRELLAEAHKRGIRVIIDLVMNHTSDEHPWFRESRQDRSNPKADWYIWHPGVNGRRPNNWFAQFELRNAWWYEPKRGEFYLGTFTRHQPEVNWRNSEVRREMFDLVRYWLDMGVDGLRLDVVNWFIKDDQFRSNPWTLKSIDLQKHLYDRSRPETLEICRELRVVIDSYEERMMVGEVFADDPGTAAHYYGKNDDGLHMAFNFNFLFQPWDAGKLLQSVKEWYKALPEHAWPNFTFSNHDNLRHCYRYRKGSQTDARARVAAALLITLRGTPFLYYGEEIGMTGGKLRRKDLRDPLSRSTWPLRRFCRDQARTPMQWEDSPNAGFSMGTAVGSGAESDTARDGAAKPWLPVAPDYPSRNVKAQSRDPESLLSFYRRLIWLRRRHAALQAGSICFPEEYLPHMLVYFREAAEEKLLVLLNFSDRMLQIKSSPQQHVPLPQARATVLEGTGREIGQKLDFNQGESIRPYEVIICSYD
jgi:alpha-glucosidase